MTVLSAFCLTLIKIHDNYW